MKRTIYFTIIVLIGFTFGTNAQLKLNISTDIYSDQTATLGNHNLESNLKLELPAEISAPSGGDLYKGLFLIGALIDMTLPIGDDFKHVAGTGFSGHLFTQ